METFSKARVWSLRNRVRSRVANLLVDESLAHAQIAPLLDGYLPWPRAALSPVVVRDACNEGVLNHRRRILEFGPGISTIVLASLSATQGIPIEVVAVESDAAWLEFLTSSLPVTDAFTFNPVLAPVTPYLGTAPVPVAGWYDPSALADIAGPFDMVLVDGPIAEPLAWRYNRWPAADFAADRLADSCAVLLDDTHRSGERRSVAQWQRVLGPAVGRRRSGSATWLTRGPAFYV
jgi:hypothetical protein